MQGKWIRKPENGTSVVFVHGIISSGKECWKHKNGTYWPRLLKNESNFKELGIYVYTYDSDIFSGTYSLNDVVDDLKERLITLDKVLMDNHRIVFVCHSMGGIVVRKFLVERRDDLFERNIEIGLYLLATPSLGSDLANWLKPLARFMGHAQADALRFAENNIWLYGLDKEFMELEKSGRLRLIGKELIEAKPLIPEKIWIVKTFFKFFWRKKVVEDFSGSRFFSGRYKVPDSDHSSIAKPKDKRAVQHQLLLKFLEEMNSKGVLLKSVSEGLELSNVEMNGLFKILGAHGVPLDDFAKELKKMVLERNSLRRELRILNGDNPQLAELKQRADSFLEKEDYAGAEQALIEARDVDLSDKEPHQVLVNKHLLSAATFDAKIGKLNTIQLKYLQAAESYHRAADLIKDADDLTKAGYLHLEGINWRQAAVYPKAEIALKAALEIREMNLGCEHLDVAEIVTDLAYLYQWQARFEEAESLHQRALKIWETKLGYDSEKVADTYTHLAEINSWMERYDDAAPLLEHARAINERLGEDKINFATTLNTLGCIYAIQKRYDEAESVLQRALAIREQKLKEHPDTAESLRSLASFYAGRGRFDEAELLYERAHKINTKIFGASHPYVALELYRQAQKAVKTKHYVEAEVLYKRAKMIAEKSLGADNYYLADGLSSFASFYVIQDRYADAEPLYKQELAIREKTQGPEHIDVGVTLNEMAFLYLLQDRNSEAEPLLDRAWKILEKKSDGKRKKVNSALVSLATNLNSLAIDNVIDQHFNQAEVQYQRELKIRKKLLGSEDITVAKTLSDLASLYAKEERYEEAERFFREALAICQNVSGTEDIKVAVSLNDLASNYLYQKRFDEAEPLLNHSWAIGEKELNGKTTSYVIYLNSLTRSLVHLALYYHSQQYFDKAKSLYCRALKIQEKLGSEDSTLLVMTLDCLGLINCAQQRYADAECFYQRALTIREKSQSSDDISLASNLNALALIFVEQKRYENAESLFGRALAIYEKTPESAPDVATILFNLAELYRIQGNFGEAEPLLKRANEIRDKVLDCEHVNTATS